MRKLVITEKANAARRIATILSDGKTKSTKVEGATVLTFSTGNDDYNMISLSGHVIELDYPHDFDDWKATSPIDLIYAPQIKTVKVKKTLDAIEALMNSVDEIIIATDFDREGELIGLETVKIANVDMSKVKRATFSSLTKTEIETAFANLTLPDEKLAEAAEARQIIDLSWGAVLTRLISLSSGQLGNNFMSVGRVQSPTLKLLVDRNEEILKFVPTPYWNVVCKFAKITCKANHTSNPFLNKNEAETIYAKCKEQKEGIVASYECDIKDEFRPSPFDTTQMQVEANKIGIRPATAMKLAEDLYMGGYISYPRTENTEYPKTLNLRNVLQKLTNSDFKNDAEEILAQDKIIPSKGKRITTDHPPIYPTASATSDKIKGDKWKLYELIVRRFLATLASNSKVEITKCSINVADEKFDAEGYVIKTMGWKKYYKKYITIPKIRIPRLNIGDKIEIESVEIDEDRTKPPYRYNQGSLIQEMDHLGLGTKSTRHDIINKLYLRNYVQGSYMVPTASGIALTKSLEKYGKGITEPGMTADLETDMLEISSGKKNLQNVIKKSQDILHEAATALESKKEIIKSEIDAALKSQLYIGICPKCGKKMMIKRSKNGNFIGCDGLPDCPSAYPLPKGATIQTVDTKCETCGLPQLKVIRRLSSPQTLCIDPKCPSNTKMTYLGTCPKCNKGHIRIMYSKTGRRFAGCTSWPDCNATYSLSSKGSITPTEKICKICNAPIIKIENYERCIDTKCARKTSDET
ncbi:MAG: DNA topoisomerase I [archaeon]|nr:DNA topoisomerase I [archaeon]